MQIINILGTDYTIHRNVDENIDKRMKDCYGFCDYTTKEICLSNDITKQSEDSMSNLKLLEHKVLRHEIIHAFLYESGLRENSKGSIAWAENEEMVDWIAIQFPKISKIYNELGIGE